MCAVFPLEDALARRQYMEGIELRLSRQKAFPFAAKMLAPLPFLGVVGEVLLGADLWASGGFHDPTVLMKEASEAFSQTGGGVGGSKHAHDVDDILFARIWQHSRCVWVPPVVFLREKGKFTKMTLNFNSIYYYYYYLTTEPLTQYDMINPRGETR